jgi:hypothetical protein
VSELVGTWHLRECTVEFSDGRPLRKPYGDSPRGLLIYTADGTMSAVLAHEQRARLDVSGLESAARAAQSEKVAAFDSYMSYAGRYRVEGDRVVHSVTHALAENAVGSELERRVSWDGAQLVLTYDRTGRAGAVAHFTLRWSKEPGVSSEGDGAGAHDTASERRANVQAV